MHPECYYFHWIIEEAGAGSQAPAALIKDNVGFRDKAIQAALETTCKYCNKKGAAAAVYRPATATKKRKHLYDVHLPCAKANLHRIVTKGSANPHAREVLPLETDEQVWAAESEKEGKHQRLKRKFKLVCIQKIIAILHLLITFVMLNKTQTCLQTLPMSRVARKRRTATMR